MLETNIPFAFEDITPLNAAFMFLAGAGGATSGGSDFGVYSGTTAGDGGVAGMIGAAQEAKNGNKSAIDKMYKITDPQGKTIKAPPVKFCVFADQVMVGEYWVYNEMTPTTVTVPINKCHQLMFWLECGDERSGQYVIYDMTVRKKK